MMYMFGKGGSDMIGGQEPSESGMILVENDDISKALEFLDGLGFYGVANGWNGLRWRPGVNPVS